MPDGDGRVAVSSGATGIELEAVEIRIRGAPTAGMEPGDKPGARIHASEDGPLAKVLEKVHGPMANWR
jgi:hypothetical protein